MNEIKVLPQDVISKIAAGEVIERPAAVLKELIENSIDAQSERIEIEVKKSGRELMRVHDDGKGISKDDLPVAVLRHSTSKINNFDDLYSLATYGFRGEALYSVFAVSKTKITSFYEGQESAYTLEGEGGAVKRQIPAAPVRGTTVEVADLFYNIPARAKFLKSDNTERAKILKTVEEAILSNSNVAFRLVVDDNEKFNIPVLPGGFMQNLSFRTEKILGPKVFSGMKEINSKLENISVFGYVSDMSGFCPTSGNQYFFVNRRPVAAPLIKQALYKAYPSLPYGKHPAAALFVELNPDSFDVNVHPQKKEVKFLSESEVFHAIIHAVGEMLKSAAQEVKNPKMSFAEISQDSAFGGAVQSANVHSSGTQAIGVAANLNAKTEEYKTVDMFDAPTNTISLPQNVLTENTVVNDAPASVSDDIKSDTDQISYIGQLAKSYLIFERAGGLLVVDQHAAQERIYFEQYLKEFADGKILGQPLIIPLEAQLSASQTAGVLRWRDWLLTAGFEIDARGSDTVILRCAPALFNFTPKTFAEFVSYLADILGNPSRVTEDVKRNIIATMACKKAIKAHDSIDPRSAVQLLKDLFKTQDCQHCPHGRQIMFCLNAYQLAKKFDRTSAL